MKKGSCRPEDVASNIPLPFVRKYPFLDEVVRDPIVCSQYRYLTIVSDGGINPNPNINQAGFPRNNLMIEFDNGDVWKIDSETHNLNIERYGSFNFTNLAHDIFIGATVQNGYGNLFLILTMEKYREVKKFKRHNPHACLTGNLAPDSSVFYWLGINRPNVAWILAIPFIPFGYSHIHVCFIEKHVDMAANMDAYCCDDSSCVVENSFATNVCVQKIVCSNRFRIGIFNASVDTAYDYCLGIYFTGKTDN